MMNNHRRGAWVIYRKKVAIAVLGYDMDTHEAQVISDMPPFVLDHVQEYAEGIRAGEFPDPYQGVYSGERWEHQDLPKVPEGTFSGALQLLWLSTIDRC